MGTKSITIKLLEPKTPDREISVELPFHFKCQNSFSTEFCRIYENMYGKIIEAKIVKADEFGGYGGFSDGLEFDNRLPSEMIPITGEEFADQLDMVNTRIEKHLIAIENAQTEKITHGRPTTKGNKKPGAARLTRNGKR